MKFHWMFSWQDLSINALKEHSKILDYYGYESVLLVYDPKNPDYFIRVANIIDKNQKLKYMFAIRTYAIAPEFLGMICESFNVIDSNRITLNICAGDKPQMEREKDIDGLVDMDFLKNDVYERIKYTRRWSEKFVNLKNMSKVPYLVFSGTSDYTLETAKMYGDSTLCMYDSFIDNPEKFKIGKNNMIALTMIISDSKESAMKIFESHPNQYIKVWTLLGTEEDIKKKLIELKNMGITDILVTNAFESEDSNKIHNLVKNFN